MNRFYRPSSEDLRKMTHNPHVLALSALLTTTMLMMQ